MTAHPSSDSLRAPGRLTPEERRALLAHVVGCARCREIYLADDESRLFSLLAARPVPAEVLNDLSEGVMEAVEGRTKSPRRPRARSLLPAVAAWAAAVLLAVGLMLVGESGPETRRVARQSGPGPSPASSTPETAADSTVGPRVVDLTVGDVQIVMIFDETLDL